MAPVPGALYGAILLMCSLSFLLLSRRLQTMEQVSKEVIPYVTKNGVSIALYSLAIPLSPRSPLLGALIHGMRAILWIYPTRVSRQ